ncbi:hypothetical protein CDAR_118381 [Caerostris darwini]|uniref:Uncharacterized protein n=1 Tax=Caerostris darwini TaxID=1538125 RepID=A0AAV4UAV0_9ARAC|nr:hypothetical protein CDAR_118381 [Caerostris darwini]
MSALYCRSQVKTMISIQQYDRPDQAEAYSKFRLEPPQGLVDIIVDYLVKKFHDTVLTFEMIAIGADLSKLLKAC